MSLTLPVELLKEFRTNVFVETGTFRGDGIIKALGAGFPNIYSIESNEYYFTQSSNRYLNSPQVHIIEGDSAVDLIKTISKINGRICFWLDAHSDTESPILKELDQIKLHPIKNHTILIDDIGLFGDLNGFKDVTKEDIISKLKEINPNYKVEYRPSVISEKGILIAYE